ncbi:MAG: hypothetical protein IPN20_24470 [Haliscomenobacter sp.]|nr:hypothetical protein [Haliscomenobacter sp.]
MRLLICFALLASATLWSCAPRTVKGLAAAATPTASGIDELIWEKYGPPLAPEYNHTFKVILSRTRQTLSIDSVRSILALKAQYKIEIGPPVSFDGCIGGDGYNLTFLNEGTVLAKGKLTDCGGQQRTNIEGNLFAFFDAIHRLAFPE